MPSSSHGQQSNWPVLFFASLTLCHPSPCSALPMYRQNQSWLPQLMFKQDHGENRQLPVQTIARPAHVQNSTTYGQPGLCTAHTISSPTLAVARLFVLNWDNSNLVSFLGKPMQSTNHGQTSPLPSQTMHSPSRGQCNPWPALPFASQCHG